MVVRLAECMGLHRDPSEYGFSPAECQTRRLIWYQICYLDIKTSSIQGPRPFIHADGYTTRLPLDLTLPTPLQTTPRPCHDLIFPMIRFECQEMQRKCSKMRQRVDQKKLSITKAISKVEAFRIAMEAKYTPFLDSPSPSPMQKMARLVMTLFISLLYPFLLHRYMNSVTYRIPDRLRQIVLVKGTAALEAAVKLDASEDLQHWAWYNSSYQEYHIAFLLLFEVFNYPLRKEASRIWACLDWIFADVLAGVPFVGESVHATMQDIIAHRDSKARHILSTISERMRIYQRAKGLRSPAQFHESMVVVTPQKAGDDLDPMMPLNYAHAMPELSTSSVSLCQAPDSRTAPRGARRSQSGTQLPSFLPNNGLRPADAWPQVLEKEGSWGIHPSPGTFGDAESDKDRLRGTRLQSSHLGDESGTTTTDDATTAHSEHGPQSQEQPLIDIDWVSELHDTLQPTCETTVLILVFCVRFSGTRCFPHRSITAIWI